MKTLTRVLAVFFGLALVGAAVLNADLVAKSRSALASAGLARPNGSPKARLHLLVILPDSEDTYFERLLEGIEATAPAVGAAIQVERYPTSSPAMAENWFETGVRTPVDGIIMYVSRDDNVAGHAAEADAAGVVFVAVGKEAPSGVLPCFIGTAPLFQGFAGGRIITGLLAQRSRIGIILPSGGTSSPKDDSLYKGVAAAVATYHGAAIVEAIRAMPGIFSAEDAAGSLLAAHPDINAIFCATSQDTLGAAQVVVDKGLVGRVSIIGADETPELLRHLGNGVVAASIVRDSRRIGVEAVKSFASMKAGLPPPGVIEVDFTVRSGGTARP
jgi:ribose transport system substrate-binding protein